MQELNKLIGMITKFNKQNATTTFTDLSAPLRNQL